MKNFKTRYCALYMTTCALWMASLKNSSIRRLSRAGFLSKADLMLPRNRDLDKKVNFDSYKYTNKKMYKHSLPDDAATPPHESDAAVVQVPTELFSSLNKLCKKAIKPCIAPLTA